MTRRVLRLRIDAFDLTLRDSERWRFCSWCSITPASPSIKETLCHFWEYRRRGWADRHWKRCYFWATHSRLQPIIDAARTLKRHLPGLLSYFAHPITNAGAEGLNSRIQAIRVSARGYCNRDHFKTAIYFYLGGLDLCPQTH